MTHQPETTVFFVTINGGTSGTVSVPHGAPEEDERVLVRTHLRSHFGWRIEDIVLASYERGNYVVSFDSATSKFIRSCSVSKANTQSERKTVHRELWQYINRNKIHELDIRAIYSHFGITTIGTNSFQNCASLTTICIPEGVTAIDEGAFAGCTALTTICIPDGVTAIGKGAFYNCRALTTVTIPDSVTSIGSHAFWGCALLTSHPFTLCNVRTIENPLHGIPSY